LRRFFDRLKGRGIFEIEWLRQAVQSEIADHGVSAAVALSGLEQCLWDIQGKVFGVPVYELLGGKLRDSVRNYANINRSTEDRTPAGFAAMAEKAVAAGFDAVKLAPFDGMPARLTDSVKLEEFTKLGLDCAAAVREVIGPERDLLIDVHSHYDLEHGRDLARRFEPLNLFWLEEATPAQPIEWLATINREAKMPTAGGETIYGVRGFYPYIAAGAVDIVMPDVKYCGGVLELKKIAALAEGAGLLVAPHGPASPVGNVVASHVCATLPNFHILEFSYGEVPWRAEVIDPPESVLKGGYLALTGRPGYGIELKREGAGDA
jgi:galactonate dehydratase